MGTLGRNNRFGDDETDSEIMKVTIKNGEKNGTISC